MNSGALRKGEQLIYLLGRYKVHEWNNLCVICQFPSLQSKVTHLWPRTYIIVVKGWMIRVTFVVTQSEQISSNLSWREQFSTFYINAHYCTLKTLLQLCECERVNEWMRREGVREEWMSDCYFKPPVEKLYATFCILWQEHDCYLLVAWRWRWLLCTRQVLAH